MKTLLTLTLLALAAPAYAAKPVPPPDHWVGTWATAPYLLDNAKTFADLGFGSRDMTLREIVHVSLGGPLVRVELTNEFGTEPLTIGAAHLALAATTGPQQQGDISLLSANALTFSGQPSIVIPPGASVLSDPAALNVPAGADLTISLFVPAQTLTHVSFHNAAYTTNYLVAGNLVGAASLNAPVQTVAAEAAGATPPPAAARKLTSWYFLKSVEVKVPGVDGAVVAFGDSITDGTGSTLNANTRWPDMLARRLQADKKTRYLGVINEGIGGNRILHDGTGPNALARFDRDVLSHPGVKYLVILEGINDIGRAYGPTNPSDPVTAQDLIAGLVQLTERAHQHGIKVIGATLTPYLGAGYSSPAGEQVRQAVNDWIRTNKLLDGVVDFDKATRDPAKPGTFIQSMQRGDQLHPNDAGYKAMGDAFDLNLFNPSPKEKYDIKFGKE